LRRDCLGGLPASTPRSHEVAQFLVPAGPGVLIAVAV